MSYFSILNRNVFKCILKYLRKSLFTSEISFTSPSKLKSTFSLNESLKRRCRILTKLAKFVQFSESSLSLRKKAKFSFPVSFSRCFEISFGSFTVLWKVKGNAVVFLQSFKFSLAAYLLGWIPFLMFFFRLPYLVWYIPWLL